MSDFLHAFRVKVHALLTAEDPVNRQPGRDLHVAFCSPGIPVAAADLDFSLRSTASAEARYAFALLANSLPGAGQLWSSTDRKLWRIWDQVLTQSALAQSTLTAAETRTLEEKRAYLTQIRTVPSPEGRRQKIIETAVYAKYKQLRASYDRATLKYNHLRITAKYSQAERDQELWQVNEPVYRRQLGGQFDDWVSRGAKNDVEKAIQLIDQVTGRGPGLHWRTLKESFRMSELTSPGGHSYYDTDLAPAEVFALPDSAWLDFSFSRDELGIRAAARSAGGVSADERLDDAGAADLESVSVQLLEAAIVRPWLDGSVFRSRAWKWSQDSGIAEPLADGSWPPRGTPLLPAYPTAVLFARNLTIRGRGLPAAAAGKVGSFALGPGRAAGDSVTNQGVQILAFLCAKVPRSPDPDPALSWLQ